MKTVTIYQNGSRDAFMGLNSSNWTRDPLTRGFGFRVSSLMDDQEALSLCARAFGAGETELDELTARMSVLYREEGNRPFRKGDVVSVQDGLGIPQWYSCDPGGWKARREEELHVVTPDRSVHSPCV